MSRERYQYRLERLQNAVIAMGDLVSMQLEAGARTLLTGDRQLARDVIDGDRVVNRRYFELEYECLELIRHYQPVATDLRIVIAAFKIATDLERVGDLAVNLASHALEYDGHTPPDVDVERLEALARELLENAIDAFVEGDPAACLGVAHRDDELDARCQAVNDRVIRTLLSLSLEDGEPEPAVLEAALQTFVIVRDLERVGDHAVNVAARTLYALESDEQLLS